MKKTLLLLFLVVCAAVVGSIISKNMVEVPSRVITDVDKTFENQKPIRDKLLNMLVENDPNSIFKVVDAIQADPSIAINCHNIAHDVGHKTYKLYGFNAAMTMDNPEHVRHALVENICAGGYVHGVLEELSLYDPEFAKRPNAVCDMLPKASRGSCFHGMGHVYMLMNNQDTVGAIRDCRVIQKDSDTYRCFEGVRMEQFWGPFATDESSEKSLQLCSALTNQDERPTCFLYSTFGYLRTHIRDYAGASALCSKSELPDIDAQFCLKGLGLTMMSKFKGKNLHESEQYVVGLPILHKFAFYQGVVGYATISGLSDIQITNACNLLTTDSQICLSAIASRE